jgi:hypothetical protein
MARSRSRSKSRSRKSRRSRRSHRRRSYGLGPKRGSCRKGYVMRKSYSRKRRGSRRRSHVKSSCIKERGKKGPGRGGPRKRKVIPKLHKGELSAFGYHDVKSMSKKKRERSLKKASKKYSPSSLVHKLNALYVLNKNQDRSAAKKFKEDRDWVSKHLEH